MLKRLNSLWVGEDLGYLERLCIVSAIEVGHPFTIYSYTPENLRGVPAGVEVRDAREVFPAEKFFCYKWAALGSDFFRYALLAKGCGYWVDLDVYMLGPFDFMTDYVFGWERGGSINGAVLRLPDNCDMLNYLVSLPKRNWRPPFFGPKRTLYFYLKRLKGDVHPDDLDWGSFGPALITHLAEKYGVAKLAQEREVFYPIRYEEAHVFSGPAETVERMLTPQTRAVHLWHSKLDAAVKNSPPPGSFLEAACRRHGI